MSDLLIEYLDYVSPDLQKIMHEWMVDYEANYAGKCSYKRFSIITKANDKDIIGILLGYTAFAEVYIEDICVKSGHRNKGIGSKLLKEVENRFANKGYNNINLVTSAFQAVEFYKKCGFKVEFIRENKKIQNLQRHFLLNIFKFTRAVYINI